MKSEQDAVSLSKKGTPAKASPSKEELSHLEARLRDMKKKTDYLDVSQAGQHRDMNDGVAEAAQEVVAVGFPGQEKEPEGHSIRCPSNIC